MSHFWYMGGYAAYVWTAYGVVLGALFGLWFFLLKQHKRLLKKISQQL